MEQLQSLIIQLAALGGLAAFIAVVVDWLKKLGLVKDGQAPVWVTGFNLIALVVLFFAVNILKIDVTKYDQLFGNVAQILVLFLSLVGQVGVSRVTHATFDGVNIINTHSSKLLMLAVAVAIVASVFIPALSASAAGPDDYLPQMVKCSSLPVSVLRVLQQSFDTQYGYDHALTNVFQWQATYETRVNQFAVLFGCPPPLANGALTFWYRVYDPIYDVPTVSGLAR